MISETLLIVSLVSIWMSLLMSTLTLTRATHFWLKHSTKLVTTPQGYDRGAGPQ